MPKIRLVKRIVLIIFGKCRSYRKAPKQALHGLDDSSVTSYCAGDGEFNITSDTGVVRLSMPSYVMRFSTQLVYVGSITSTFGYSLQLISPIQQSQVPSVYSGEWRSQLLTVSGSRMCLSINVFVPDQLYLYVDMHYNLTMPSVRKVFDVGHFLKMSEMSLVSEIPLITDQQMMSKIQLVVYVSNNTIIKHIQVTNDSCTTSAKSPYNFANNFNCEFDKLDYCGFVDSSPSTSRWVTVSQDLLSNQTILTGHEDLHDRECMTDSIGRYYMGTTNTTLSGRPCQSWSSQSPHVHPYDDVAYFPDNATDLDQLANYCRNPSMGAGSVIDKRPWCYTGVYDSIANEYCDIEFCKVYFVQVSFGSGYDSAVLISRIFNVSSSICLKFYYRITTAMISFSIMTSSPGHSRLLTVSMLSYIDQKQPAAWNEAIVPLVDGVATLALVANKTGITEDRQYVAVDRISLVPYASCFKPALKTVRVRQPYVGRRLAQNSYQQVVLDETKDMNMTELNSRLGHQKSDFIHECVWNKLPCVVNSIVPQQTSLGLCYTFNADKNNVYKSNTTGPEAGLRLTINLEQYENIPSSDTDSGIKMYLHGPDDVASVSDLGFALEPGKHALVDIGYTKTTRLQQPWGTCGTQPLHFYEPTEQYLSGKCEMECKVASLLRTCSCKMPYMPGSNEECTLPAYYACSMHWPDIVNTNESSQCSCINDCTTYGYPSTTSTSQLVLGPSLLLTSGPTDSTLSMSSSATGSTLTSRFQRAIEVADRVDDSAMTDTATLLMNVLNTHRKLGNTMNMQIFDGATSIIGIVTRFWTNVGLSMSENMKAAYTDIIKLSITVYDQYVKDIVDSLSSELLSVGDLVANVRVIVASAANDGNTTMGQLGQVKSLGGRLADLSNLLDGYDSLLRTAQQANPGFFFPMNLITGEVCVQTKKDLAKAIHVMLYDLLSTELDANSDNNTVVPGGDESLKLVGNVTAFFVNSSALRTLMTSMSNCVNAYRRQLDDFVIWINATIKYSINSIDSISPLSSLTSLFVTDYANLARLYNSYLSNAMTKRELAMNLGELQGSVVQQNVESLVSDVEATVLTPLFTLANSMETILSTSIIEANTRLFRLQDFMSSNNTAIEEFARASSIWRMPVINLQDPQLFRYTLTRDQTWTVWPIDTSFSSFMVSGMCDSIIQLIIGRACEGVRDVVTQTKIEILSKKQEFVAAFTALQDSLTTFSSKGNSLTSDNYLKVDIYYGELKVQSTEQDKAYDVMTFFSDFGGYFGLLLGGSVLSVFEFLDLLVYNGLIKLTTKRKSRDETTRTTSTATISPRMIQVKSVEHKDSVV